MIGRRFSWLVILATLLFPAAATTFPGPAAMGPTHTAFAALSSAQRPTTRAGQTTIQLLPLGQPFPRNKRGGVYVYDLKGNHSAQSYTEQSGTTTHTFHAVTYDFRTTLDASSNDLTIAVGDDPLVTRVGTQTGQGSQRAPLPAATAIPVSRQQVGTAGGAVQAQITQHSAQGTAVFTQTWALVIPAGAFTETVHVGIDIFSFAAVPTTTQHIANVPIGAAVSVKAINGSGHSVTRFSVPLIVQLSYPLPVLGSLDQRTLTMAYYNTSSRQWVALPTARDPSADLLTAQLDHFTLFQVRATARTPAQLHAALAAAAVLSASARPVVPVLDRAGAHNSLVAPGGVPVLFTLPHGGVLASAPAAVHVLGAPHATLMVVYQWLKTRVVRTVRLNSAGYAAVPAPSWPSYVKTARVASPLHVSVTAIVSLDGVTARSSATFTLVPPTAS